MTTDRSDIVYFDNAATSWPKPPQVAEAMTRLLSVAASPGRSSHAMANKSAGVIHQLRARLASMIHAQEPERLILTANATDALNTAIQGVVSAHFAFRPDHLPRIVSTTIEHNSVRRPLNELHRRGLIDLVRVESDCEGFINPGEIIAAANDDTILVTVMHASNVTGAIQPIEEIGPRLRREKPGALLLVDASQTMGAVPIDIQTMCVDLLAFTGHKSLLGPTGTGGLYVGPRAYSADDKTPRLVNIRQGGTGLDSESEVNPRQLPCHFECGTPNTVGFAGLLAALDAIAPDAIRREREHVGVMLDALDSIRGVTTHGPRDVARRTAAVSVTIDGLAPRIAATMLDESFNIASRAGLHCAPDAHRAIGTHPVGTLRFSPGQFTTDEEVQTLLRAVREIASGQLRPPVNSASEGSLRVNP